MCTGSRIEEADEALRNAVQEATVVQDGLKQGFMRTRASYVGTALAPGLSNSLRT